MRIRGVDLINYIIYKGLVSCWGPKPLASEVMSSSPSMLSIVVGFWSSAMVGNIWYLFQWLWLPNFTRSLRSSLAMLSSSLVEIGPVGDDLFKSRRRIGAPWPSWCGCIVCAMSDEQQCAMCLSDYDLSRIKISWRSLLEFLRGFVCLDEAPYTARWPWIHDVCIAHSTSLEIQYHYHYRPLLLLTHHSPPPHSPLTTHCIMLPNYST